MKRKMTLSITLGSMVGLSVAQLSYAATLPNTEPTAAVSIKAPGGGKCASGKCGTEKIYSKAKINHNPQDKLVRSRDGKCGLDGNGLQQENPEKVIMARNADGICGQ